MAEFGVTQVWWNQAELHAVLRARGGMVDRWTFREAQKVVNHAKVKVSGPPHGYYRGRMYSQNPGGPPGVRTGAGRRSIRARPDTSTAEASWMISSDIPYMGILEMRHHAPYPWLIPSLAELGYAVRMGLGGFVA